MNSEHAVLARLDGVGKSHGPIKALTGVDLTVCGGQMLALLGPNGAGKSTAIGLLLGQGRADAGTVSLFGASPHELAVRRRIGVMLQSAGIPDMLKVSELLALTCSYYANPRSIADCVMLAGLDGLMERRYGRLSGGQQRRVQFALAICGRPELLFLDEPTTGLDIEARRTLWRAIRELVGSRGGVAASQYLLATYGVFGVMGVALFGFGVSVAIERENGYLELKRALPMPPGAYLLAKMAMAALFSAIISVLLATLGTSLGGVSLAPGQWTMLWLVNIAGALPLCAIGLYIGSLVGGSGAPAVVNLVYMPMAFLSGLWMPLSVLPPVFAKIAPLWPAWHLGQLALKVVGRDAGASTWMHVGVLAAITVVFFVFACRRLSH